MKNIDFNTPVQPFCGELPRDSPAFGFYEGRWDVESLRQQAGDFTSSFLGKVQVISFRAGVVGETNDLDLFYAWLCQETAISLQGIGILHQVFVEVELDIVNDDSIGGRWRRRYCIGI